MKKPDHPKAKVTHYLGFWSVIASITPVVLMLLMFFLLFIGVSEQYFGTVDYILISAGIILPIIGLGLAIGGFIKDERKIWAVLGVIAFIPAVLFIFFVVFFLFRSGPEVVNPKIA